jgi:bifunctional DNA-binding transcriptional regulator/antitoxin component of YhaV-PrlF toxin-antitoxin module
MHSGLSFTFVKEVRKAARNRRRGTSRISSKHQVTIPVDALRAAGIEVGERVVARADGPGRVVLEREDDVLAGFAGRLTGVYDPDELDQLRDEWD